MLFSSFVSFGQSYDELQTINDKSKSQFVKPESLDQLMIVLRKYEASQVRSQDTLLLDTYKNISSAYMANNHFKQAYEVFQKYIIRKENMLSADKSDFLNQNISSVTSRKQKDDNEEMELQSRLKQLKEDNAHLDVRQNFFKRNFSLALIILTAIFALVLVNTGIRMMNLRSNLQQNRDRMKSIHRLAVTGKFSSGLISGLNSVLKSSEEQTRELGDDLKKQEQILTPVKQANQIFSGIEKSFKEVSDFL